MERVQVLNRSTDIHAKAPASSPASSTMNGAESLVRTLLASGVDTCFANPGTSEMHFVAALDKVEGMRCILGLHETVVTGCADGYARMTGRPAATLLHCGPGLANGMANVHNARRANAPMVNIVGDHALHHRQYDTPLTTDVEGMARTVSHWVKTSQSAANVGADGAAAVQAALTAPGQVATLILPADTSWNEGGVLAARLPVATRAPVAPEVIRAVARVLRAKEPTMLVLAGQALTEEGLVAANRVAFASGAVLRTPSPITHMVRGRGRVPVDRIPYNMDAALKMLSGIRNFILVGAKPPTQFFAYPGRESLLAPSGAMTYLLARPEQDMVAALHGLADELGAPKSVPIPVVGEKALLAKGGFTPEAFASTLGALLPENAIVEEDAVTSGRQLFGYTYNSPPHDWLQITGGAIGHGFPCATGAAIACPDRKVVCLEADGAGMYTLQALWTQARENLDVVNVIFANRVYKILQGELVAVGATPGPASKELFDIARPELDWVKLAGGMGVEAVRVEDLEGFADTFKSACSRRGPFLIEFRI
jgi:acetolactate synthase-1/2/3 large subunit